MGSNRKYYFKMRLLRYVFSIFFCFTAALFLSCDNSPNGLSGEIPDGPLHLSTTVSSSIATIGRIPEKISYELGDTVKMYAVTHAGYTFTGWSGDIHSVEDTIVFVMNENKTIYANFKNSAGKTVFSLVTSSINGSVTLSPDGGIYESGTTVFAYARPDYGFNFKNWTGAINSRNDMVSLVVTGTVHLTANFLVDPSAEFATIQIDPAPANGKLVMDPAGFQSGNTFSYEPGTPVTISAVSDSGFEFQKWGKDFSDTSTNKTSVSLTLTMDYTITAEFTKSPEGVNWRPLESGNQNGLISIIEADNRLVIAGNNGTILTSENGETWISRTTGVTTCLNCVIWTGDLFVCVGDGGTILTSADGTSWEQKTSSTKDHLQSVVWTGSQFVAVGGRMENSSTNYSCILTSSDGSTWKKQSSGSGIWYSVVWNGNKLVGSGYDFNFSTVSDYSTSFISTSTDGINWKSSSTYIPREASFTSIIWTGTKFVAVGGSRSSQTYSSAYTSNDGNIWEKGYITTQSFINDVTWTGNTLVSVGEDGEIYYSKDAQVWEKSVSGTTDDIYDITWTGKRLYAVGFGGLLLTSP